MHRTRWGLVGGLFVLMAPCLGDALRARGGDASPVGKEIILTQRGVAIGHIGDDGKRHEDGVLDYLVYDVEEEKGDWIRVDHRGVSGWVPRQETVPVQKAEAYFTDRIRKDKTDDFAYGARGVVYLEAGNTDAALNDFDKAIQLNPKDPVWFWSRGLYWSDKGEGDKAITDLDEAIRLDPKRPAAFLSRGRAWLAKGECDQAIGDLNEAIRLDPSDIELLLHYRAIAWMAKSDYDKTIADFSEIIRLDPKNAAPFQERAGIWLMNGEFDKAIAGFDEAIRLDPTMAPAFDGRGMAWWQKREYDKAIADLNEAIRLDPTDATATNNRGVVWLAKKEYAKALADFNESIRLSPEDHARTMNHRARLLATCPDEKIRDGKQAVLDARKICQGKGSQDPTYLATLAAACAETGDFGEAVKWQTQVVALLSKAKEPVEDAQKRLALYKSQKPYHGD